MVCNESLSWEELEVNIATDLEKQYNETKRKIHDETSPPKMRIALNRGEKTVGYSGKLTYCGGELLFDDDEEREPIQENKTSFPTEALNDYQNLASKAEELCKNKRAKLGEDAFHVSEDELPVCLTQMREIEEQYPGIETKSKIAE